MRYNQISAFPQFFEEVLKILETGKHDGKTLIWFGYTDVINALQKALMSKGRRLDFAIDNAKVKQGLDPFGYIKCFHPDILEKYRNNGVVFIAARHKDAMARQVRSYGYTDEQIVYCVTPDEIKEDLRRKRFGVLDRLKRIENEDIKKIELEILINFRDFCEKHNLRYYLAEGTLLGAVRHKGFIPWDYDVDVFMPDEDYKKLLEIYPKDGPYELWNWDTYPDHDITTYRLTVPNTLVIYERTISYLKMRVFIDIYPLAGFPADEHLREERFREIYAQNFKWMSMYYLSDYCGNRTEILRGIEEIKYQNRFSSGEYTGMLHFVYGRVRPWAVPRECFEQRIDVEFEGELFKAPAGYDEYLTERYGDYMTPLPENERLTPILNSYRLDGKDIDI